MTGQKRVEFRKTTFSRTPSHVVVYASSPVQKVLGYFEVSAVDVNAVDVLWERYATVGGVGEAEFGRYYAGRESGVALSVGGVVHARTPAGLADLGLSPRPPQNFAYVESDVLGRLHGLELVRERCVGVTSGAAKRGGRLRGRARRSNEFTTRT